MSRPANASRFGENGSGGTWYSPPYPRSIAESAQLWPQFARRAAWLHAQYPTGKIGMAGVGFALTPYWLWTNHARQSWSCDVQWAADIAKTIVSASIANNVMAADVTNATQMTAFRRLGNTGSARYDVLFTEDLLPSASTITEAQLMLTRLRAVGTTLVHLVTPVQPGAGQTSDMLWLTLAEWRTVIGPTEAIVTDEMIAPPPLIAGGD